MALSNGNWKKLLTLGPRTGILYLTGVYIEVIQLHCSRCFTDEEDEENLSISCHSEPVSRSRVASVGTYCGSANDRHPTTPKLTITETGRFKINHVIVMASWCMIACNMFPVRQHDSNLRPITLNFIERWDITLFHIYFRLMTTTFDLPLTLTSCIVDISPVGRFVYKLLFEFSCYIV